MHPLLQKQEELHNEGTSLLEKILLPILEQYGKVSVGGSYSYKLLNYPDLDIDVVSENVSKDLFANLCGELIRLDFTSKFKSGDRVNYPHAPSIKRPFGYSVKRPFGYWVSPDINFGNSVWKIDIWLQKPEWYTGDTNRYAEKLLDASEEKRITILSLKEELIEKNLYGVGKEFVSEDVYEGVLRGDVKTVDDLRDFLTANHN
ncbi:hypothetical protein HY416_00650 [Candidatus Kaiserbacteria bacterium]|nr:hypothetical protein [Candidatus Kaiserbacteria bacterium]